ncbi:MAG: DNA polymerase Y family protein [Gammaproteobacteria bacterium]
MRSRRLSAPVRAAKLPPASAAPAAPAVVPPAPVPAGPGESARALRWLCLRFAQLPLEVFARAAADGIPSLVFGSDQRVLCVDAGAAGLGIRPGMNLGAAHAFGEVRAFARDETREHAALELLAACAYGYSSQVSISPPDALVLEVRGSFALFGGPRRLLERIESEFGALGFGFCAASAPTPLAATLLARTGRAVHAGPRDLAGTLARLPIEVLDIDADTHRRLLGIGVRCLGDLLRLPRGGLSRRFGTVLVADLDRALGRSPDPRPAYVPPPRFDQRLELPAPAHASTALLFAAHRQIQALAAFLRARVGGVERMHWCLEHEHRAGTDFTLELVAPRADAGHIALLLAERFERLALPAPVTALRLQADRILPLPGASVDLFADAPARVQAGSAALVERLRARLGDAAVTCLCLVPDHRPERAGAAVRPESAGVAIRSGRFDPAVRSDRAGDATHPGSVPLAVREPSGAVATAAQTPCPRRPLWLLERPRLLECTAGRPWLGGPLVPVRERERIEAGWWDGADVRRDYFVVVDPAGALFWIFLDLRDRRWYLHGIFE